MPHDPASAHADMLITTTDTKPDTRTRSLSRANKDEPALMVFMVHSWQPNHADVTIACT